MAQELGLILVKSFVIIKRTGLFLMVNVSVLDSIPVIANNIKCVLKGLYIYRQSSNDRSNIRFHYVVLVLSTAYFLQCTIKK